MERLEIMIIKIGEESIMKIFLDANICLDLLDTTRATSKDSVNWYLKNKNDKNKEFFFFGDFITTIFYVLTQNKKIINPLEEF